jgi:hypothetical protein
MELIISVIGLVFSGQLSILSSITVSCGTVVVATGQGLPSGLLGQGSA